MSTVEHFSTEPGAAVAALQCSSVWKQIDHTKVAGLFILVKVGCESAPAPMDGCQNRVPGTLFCEQSQNDVFGFALAGKCTMHLSGFQLNPCSSLDGVYFVGFFPGEVWQLAAKVTVRSSLSVDWTQ